MKKSQFLIGLVFLFFMFLFSVNAKGQSRQRVQFERGATSVTLRGIVKGYAYRDYIIRASAQQQMTISLSATGISPVFTVFLPNKDNLEGATQMNDFSGEIPKDGDYTIRVMLMRAFARRRQSSNYTLEITIR